MCSFKYRADSQVPQGSVGGCLVYPLLVLSVAYSVRKRTGKGRGGEGDTVRGQRRGNLFFRFSPHYNVSCRPGGHEGARGIIVLVKSN